MYEVYQRANVRNGNSFKKPVLICTCPTTESAQRIIRSINMNEDGMSGRWAEKGGNWFRGSTMVFEVVDTEDKRSVFEKGVEDNPRIANHMATIAMMWSTWLKRRGLLSLHVIDERDVAIMLVLYSIAMYGDSKDKDHLPPIVSMMKGLSDVVDDVDFRASKSATRMDVDKLWGGIR